MCWYLVSVGDNLGGKEDVYDIRDISLRQYDNSRVRYLW